MKKLLTIAMLCASALAANAQTEKGKFILGGTIGYSSRKSEDQTGNNKVTNLDLLPSAGYFVSENLALGLGIGYSRNVNEIDYKAEPAVHLAYYIRKDISDYFTISPFIRHYINISEKFKFFSQFSVPMKWGNTKVEVSGGGSNPAADLANKKSKTTSIGVGIEPGLVYFPSKKIGIQLSVAGLSYIWNKTEDGANSFNNDVKSHAFNLGTNFLAPRIGVQFYF
jgi:opacity protein-like surface antigen